MSEIVGLSLIIGKGIFHAGKFQRGVWFDNCELLKLPKEERTGFGFKIDLCFGRTIRPIGMLWKKEYWNNEKLRIMDIPEDQWDDFFGEELAIKIRHLKIIDIDRLKHGAYNPWYGKRWFVLRLSKWLPSIFISIGFGTFLSFYFGNKAYQVDPFTRDITWTNEADRVKALDKSDGSDDYYFALCPSFTFRKTRQT